MTAGNLAAGTEVLIVGSVEEFAQQVEQLQTSIYNQLIRTVKGLDLDNEGYILQNNANRKILYELEGIIDTLLPGQDFTAIVSETIAILPQIDALNSEYFSNLSDKFTPTRNYFKVLQSQTIEKIESFLLRDGLAFAVKTPLKDIMNLNINTGGSFSGFLDQLRNFIKGDEDLDGRLLSYSRGLLRDTLFNYSRAYQQAVTADLGLSYYLYAGGVMDKTRPFCMERVGNFYHESEIKLWANQEWQGKNKDTTESSIFVYCGGYNCAHSLIPVSETLVPEEQRITKK
jgi:hypothetical protein